MSIRTSLTQATTASFGVVTSSANSVSSVFTTVEDLSRTGGAYARHLRVTTEKELSLSADEMEAIAEDRAKLRIARAQLSILDELATDTRLQSIYDSITFTK